MFNHETAVYLTWILFALTYIGLALGKVPGLQHGPGRHRPGRGDPDAGHRHVVA